MVFVQPHDKPVFRGIVATCALQASPEEPEADKHRVKIEACDYSKGDPVACIAKYVSKNIDGHGIEADEEGLTMLKANEQIEGWASIY